MVFLDSELGKVIFLGLCFTVIFSSDFTVTNMQKTLSVSIQDDKPDYTVDGYVSLGLVYAIYGIFLWLAPPLIAFIGAKNGLVLGSIGYIIFVFSFLVETTWATYLGMIFGGIGGSILWVSQANYMVLSSSRANMTRNVSIFWILFASSLLFGNLYAVFELEGKSRIDGDTRHTLLYVLGAVVIAGMGMVMFLPSPKGNKFNKGTEIYEEPLMALKKTWLIFCRKEMIILLASFIYAGFQQSFGQGIYSPCIGFTQKFGAFAKQLVPMSGLIYGIGDITGGITQTFLAKNVNVFSWWPSFTVICGFVVQVLGYILIYFNLPNNAIFGETSDSGIMDPSITVALLCSFLLGFGDSCINTQMFPLLANLEPNSSAQTSALYKFVKSMTMAVCFFVSPYLGLHVQLTVMIAGGILGTLAFSFVSLTMIQIK